MALTTLGGQLLRVGQQLALSAYCCCTGRWCRETGKDDCGNPVYGCSNTQAGSIGECTPECKPPEEPCECGPDKPCEPCFECIDQKCVRIEDCCTSDEDCGPCSKCVNGVCVPCGECEQCIDGICLPCGPCQKCEDGECVDCGANEVCIGGVCVPKQYYCCWDSCDDKEDNNNNTTCKQATVSGSGQTSPCGNGTYTEGENEGEECDLTKSGPYTSLAQCEPNCRKYACEPAGCGNNVCVPDPDGEYPTLAACLAACDDPCSGPCTFAGASAPGIYAIDGCEREICVSYVSTNSRPIRVQIWGPIMIDGCPVPGSRVIKTDTDWRGDECCDCPDDRGQGNLEGRPQGQIKWTKPRGATHFEVVVSSSDPTNPLHVGCSEGYDLDIRCDASCTEHPDPDPCPCEGDGDCAEDCHCCDGVCQHENDCDCCGGGANGVNDPRHHPRKCCPEGEACCGHDLFGQEGACYVCSDLNGKPNAADFTTPFPDGCAWFAQSHDNITYWWSGFENSCAICDMDAKLGCHCPDPADSCGDPNDPANWELHPSQGGNRWCLRSCENPLP